MGINMKVDLPSTVQASSSIGDISLQNTFRFLWFFVTRGTIFIWLAFPGCNGSDTSVVSHGGPVRDHVSLVDTLRGQGLTVEPTGPVTQPFFPIPGQILHVNGQDIQVFEFESPSSRENQQKKISADGMSVGQTVIQWIDPPHFFAKGKILVLYVGKEVPLLQHLEEAMGKQVAGGTS